MKPNPVGWFEIYVSDMTRAKKFYQSVFECELTRLPGIPNIEMWAFPMDRSTMGAGGTLVKMAGAPSGGSSVIVYFSSDDCSVEEKRVLASGGKIHRSKTSIGENGFISLAIDTENNMFGIHSLA